MCPVYRCISCSYSKGTLIGLIQSHGGQIHSILQGDWSSPSSCIDPTNPCTRTCLQECLQLSDIGYTHADLLVLYPSAKLGMLVSTFSSRLLCHSQAERPVIQSGHTRPLQLPPPREVSGLHKLVRPRQRRRDCMLDMLLVVALRLSEDVIFVAEAIVSQITPK